MFDRILPGGASIFEDIKCNSETYEILLNEYIIQDKIKLKGIEIKLFEVEIIHLIRVKNYLIRKYSIKNDKIRNSALYFFYLNYHIYIFQPKILLMRYYEKSPSFIEKYIDQINENSTNNLTKIIFNEIDEIFSNIENDDSIEKILKKISEMNKDKKLKIINFN